MKSVQIFVSLFSFILLTLLAKGETINTSISKNDYIEQWKATAVQQEIQYGIPASITLAQGILESAYGNSELAIEANNHFGIKCHNWEGKKYYHDDETKGECFRKYASAADSYKDHSQFLVNNARYAFLFDYATTDYKSWAKGLKKAGYATNPSYPDLIISTIENNNLTQLDNISPSNTSASMDLIADAKKSTLNLQLKTVSHQVKINKNKVNYIVAKKGDTFYRIAKEFDKSLWDLYHYNDFDKHKDVLEVGDIVYLQAKRFHAKGKVKTMRTQRDMSAIEISQQEGIRVKSLMKLNVLTSEDYVFEKGSRIILKR
jgi:LysM repeat protein